ncbi:MAG: sulfite exporter TauE/SafE family protein [Verrucomicrobia subdivision 3 bacterium]|nr:sulfite exporter TauE/SafE family protein [Limisphaerales bacterium]
MTYLIAGLIGLVGGITSGLFGVGGGVIMVPAMLLLLSPPVRDVKQAIGTSLAVIIPTALMGTWRHHDNSNVEWRIALLLTPTAIAGSVIGVHLVKIIPAEDLKRAFGGFLVLVGLKLVFFK